MAQFRVEFVIDQSTGKYLAEMIGLIGGDTITLKFGADNLAPVLMMPRDGDEVLSVLMPLKLFQ